MDLDHKWKWVSRKLPRRVLPLGQLFETTKADGRGLICDQLGISQTEMPISQQLGEGELLSAEGPEAAAAAATMASRRGGTVAQQAVRRNPHKKVPPPKSPPRRVILNQKLERVQAALKNTAGMVEADVGKASGEGSRCVIGAGGSEEEDEEEDRRRTLLAALMEVEGAKKQRQGASAKKAASSSSSTPSSMRRASTMTVTSGGTKGSGERAATKPTKTTPTTAQQRGSTHLQRRGTLFDLTSSNSGAMASTGGGGPRGTKGAAATAATAATAGGAVEHESGGIQLKPPTPIDHRRKSRLPDYFGEGDEKSLGFNLRNLHLFPLPRTPLEGVGEDEGGGREDGAAMTTAAPRAS